MLVRTPSHRLARADLTWLLPTGLAGVVAGAVADVAFHVRAPLGPVVAAWLGSDGHNAHLLTFVGMLVAVVGLIVRARASGSS